MSAVPVTYVVSIIGENIDGIRSKHFTTNVMRATINLPAVDSDIDVIVATRDRFIESSSTLRDKISELTTYCKYTYMYFYPNVWED